MVTFMQYMNKFSLPYQTSRRLKVDYWWAGLGYYVISLVIIALYLNVMINSGTYLKREMVEGVVNPYVQEYTHPLTACKDPTSTVDCATKRAELSAATYCTDPNMGYWYDPTFRYVGKNGIGGPVCQQVSVYEMSNKDEDLVTFSTSYTEWQTYAYPCSHASDVNAAYYNLAQEATATCDAGTLETDGTQCSCTAEKAVFPLAIEDYMVKMPHGYDVKDLSGVSWKGESRLDANEIAQKNDPSYPKTMTTTIKFPDGEGGETTTAAWANDSRLTLYIDLQ